MQPFSVSDETLAQQVYEASPTHCSQQFLDLLIANPGEMFDSDAVQLRLALADHRDVARTAYALGEVAASLDRKRPWNEAQRGYFMTPEVAALFPH